MTKTQAIRHHIKQQRQALSAANQQSAARALAERFFENFQLTAGQKIGVYLAVGGEIALRSIIEQAWQLDAEVYLPVLCTEKDRQLYFAPYYPDSAFSENRFGIAEPIVLKDDLLLPDALDIALIPLLAFDEAKNRIGMGGGFYDASFASLRDLEQPKRIGCAYEFQKVDHIEAQPWDVPMHHVLTDLQAY